MIYILIELNGFRQLKKIDSIFTDEIVKYITRTFSSDECSFVEQKNSIFIFSCKPDREDLTSLFNNTINLFNYLNSIKIELSGFNLLIDYLSGEYTNQHFKILIQHLFTLEDDESFYISSENLSLFEKFADFEQEGDFLKLVAYHENKIDTDETIINVLSHSREMERFFDYLSPLINNEKRGMFFYYGENVPGLSIMSYCIAGLLQGKDSGIPWLYIKPENSKISYTNSIVNCMDRQFLDKVPSFLNKPELSLWGDKKHLIFNTNSIVFDEDAIILFRIYLKAYSSFMEEKLMPAIIFILDSHDFEDLELKYISDVLEDLYIDFNLIPVLFSENEAIPAPFYGFQGIKVKSKAWELNINDSFQIESPVSFYHFSLNYEKENIRLSGPDSTLKVLNELGHNSRRFLIIYSLFYNLADKEEIISYLSTDQNDKYRNENYYFELVAKGLIFPDKSAEPVFKDIYKTISYRFNSEDELIIDKIINNVLDKSKGFKITVYEKIANLYRKLGKLFKEAEYLLKVIDLLIISGKTDIAGPFFERIASLLRADIEDKKIIELRQNIYFLKAAIYDNKDDFAADINIRLNKCEVENQFLNTERKIVCSEYLFAMYKYKKSLDIAKTALIDIQDSKNFNLKTIINLHLARILMGMKRIDESMDYFKIAKETVDRESDLYILIEINTHEAVVNFIDGNFSESLRLVDDSLSLCKKTGRRNWELFLLFLKGRISFELGDYSNAVILFSEGLRQCDIYMYTSKKSFFNIWMGRSYIYMKEIRYGLKILMDFQDYPEALYFSSEGLFFLEEYNNAYGTINLAFTMERDRNRFFCSSNITSFESGYDFIEDRCLVVEGGYGVLFQLIRAFRAFLMSKTKNEIEGRLELAKLTREERLSDIDLNNGFYYYLHSLTLPRHTGAEAVDRLTLLSKALRYIQKTASNIDNPKHRQMYLSRNYWNSGLMKEGRAQKLI